MDDSIQSWTGMLDRVVRQEVEKAKKVTSWAKEEISHAREGKIFFKSIYYIICKFFNFIIP